MTESQPLSLLTLLREGLDHSIPFIECSQTMLMQFVHLLLETVVQEQLPAIIFTGFQDSAYWHKETQRYQNLAKIAEQLWIFTDASLPEVYADTVLGVEPADDDPLKHEWFLLIYSKRLPVLLCGRKQPQASEPDGMMNALWSFSPAVIDQAFNLLAAVIKHQYPDRYHALQAARPALTSTTPDMTLVARVTFELIQLEERGNHELHHQHQMMNAILNALNFHVYVTRITPQKQLISVYRSPNLELITGYTHQQLRSEPRFWYARIHPEDRSRADLYWERLERGEGGTFAYRIRHADGRIIWVQHHTRVHNYPITGDKLVYGIFYDITDEVALRGQQQLSAMKTSFMSLVSHEFRTPLATILSSTELLMHYDDRLTPASRTGKLHTIQKQVEHMTQMLDHMTTVLRGERLKMHPVQQQTDVYFQQVLNEFLDEFPPGQVIRYTLDCEYAYIRVDPKLLTPVIIHLLSNAVKFSSPDSEIQYHVAADSDWLIIEIADQGIGILPEDEPHIFEPLFRGNNVAGIIGTGLGLKIVADYVAIQGGTVTFNSVENIGTTFTVCLPLDV